MLRKDMSWTQDSDTAIPEGLFWHIASLQILRELSVFSYFQLSKTTKIIHKAYKGTGKHSLCKGTK